MKRQEEEESPNTYVNVLGGTVVEYQDKIGKMYETQSWLNYFKIRPENLHFSHVKL